MMLRTSQKQTLKAALVTITLIAGSASYAASPGKIGRPDRIDIVLAQGSAQHSNRGGGYSHNRSVYSPVVVRGHNYFYRNGLYYRRHNDRYLVIDPPRGAHVGYLPDSAISLVIGPHRYFRVGLTWYLRKEQDNKTVYEVVEKPDVNTESTSNTYSDQKPDLVIYPAEGQSTELQDKDRYECYRWSRDQSGYDPTLANQDLTNKDMYQRAMAACLESRGYTVK